MLHRRTCIAAFLALFSFSAYAQVTPLPRAHSHNDYNRERPLLDALDRGFCSIEADIHLAGEQLLVAHDAEKTTAEKTLQAMYLDPLLERAKANGGKIYPDGPEVILLIDIKSDGVPTYERLRTVLEGYKEMLTEFTHDSTTPRAVTVVISGDSPREMILMDSPRLAAVDGRLQHLDSDANVHQIPLISDSWNAHFSWRGEGEMPAEERAKLDDIVARAHARGHKVRFWGIPRPRNVWPVLYDAGVDLLNADNLDQLKEFLLGRMQGAQAPEATPEPVPAPEAPSPTPEVAPAPEATPTPEPVPQLETSPAEAAAP